MSTLRRSGLGHDRREKHGLASGLREAADTGGGQLAEVVGHRHEPRPDGAQPTTLGCEPGDLERVERVAPARLRDPDQIGRGSGRPRRSAAIRPSAASDSRPSTSRVTRCSAAPADEAANGDLVVQSTPTRSSSSRRAANSNTRREGPSSHCQSSTARISARSAARPRIRLRNPAATARASGPPRGGLPARERHLERLALRIRQRRERLLVDPCQQIRNRGERELRLRRRRPAPEHRRPTRLRPPARLLPHRRLADAGVALDHQHREARGRRLEEPIDFDQLRITTNDAGLHRGQLYGTRQPGPPHRSVAIGSTRNDVEASPLPRYARERERACRRRPRPRQRPGSHTRE